ncbi:LytTR family DNA-binding domain-containing protein [uncultured Winogradskyella sp.]|uniref:LytR/AlgR family response regulator transcription factor n=1 Tax=uncultured Winogradskyella sp. TaxID=395353 RepID=UPI00262032D9|nr:LytTR family DNA-binding domain-containing protein [uncultured Winogradskyella sp.]
MKCIIIDDEPLAIKVVESYCNALGSLTVVKTFTNALEALDFLNNNRVDLVFSDIEMPQISGIDFIKSIENNRPFFIFTTAYPQYALEGFDLNATDYLVKPIPFPRFIKAINRVKELLNLNQNKIGANLSSAGYEKQIDDDFIFIKSEYENLKLNVSEILFIQGLKDYLKIVLVNTKPVLTLMNFKQILHKLPNKQFLRVHRSYVVNVNKISSIQKNKIILNNERIPIGEVYKSEVYNRFKIK